MSHVKIFMVDIDHNFTDHEKHAYMPIIENADNVAEKYFVTRESLDV